MSSSTSTSLTLRALLKTAAGRLGLGVPGKSVSGLTAAAKGFFAAAAVARNRVVLVVPTDADVEQVSSDARFFLSALEGVSDGDAAQLVVPFPSHEIDPYRGLSPHFDIASARAQALFALSNGTARLVIASAASLLPRLSPPARFKESGLTLRTGDEISPTDLGDRLAAAGYTRQDPTDEPGEFSVRGGVVDFYPAGARQPIRLEFIGDNIESLRTYDPGTQRSIEPIDQAHIVPLQELLLVPPEGGNYRDGAADAADRSATFIDYLAAAQPIVLVAEPDEVRATILKQREQIEASHAEAVRKNQNVPEPASLVVAWDDVAPTLEAATGLDNLVARLQEKPRIKEWAGRLPTGETKFRVTAADPDAAARPRTTRAGRCTTLRRRGRTRWA